MGDIAISSGVRSNLLALQNTAKLMEQTQNRLSTGNRVNSALDNPANFFTASAMSNRASDLSSLLDSMSTGVNTLKAADAALTSITKLVESAQGTARQALQDSSGEKNSSLQTALGMGGATDKATAEAKALTALGGGTALDAADAFEFKVTDSNGAETSVSVTVGTKTVADLVDEINSTIGDKLTATVNDDGTLTLETVGGGDLDITLVDDTTTGTNGIDDLLGANVYVNGSTSTTATDTDTDLAVTAPTAEVNETRTTLASTFDSILDQITDLASDADFNGVNLLDGDSLKVIFNEKTGSNENSLSITGVTFDYDGIGLSKTTGDFQSDTEIQTRLDQITAALDTLRSQAAKFGSNLTTVQTRQDFATTMINVLESGASDLTLADTNAEGANMLALQTRQSLATTTMSMASSADQSVLSFLR